MRSGLDVILSDPSALAGARVGLCCNHTAVTADFDHALPQLIAAGVPIRRLFGPEHGIDSTAQDMIAVDAGLDRRYTREILSGLVAAGVIDYSPADATFGLSDEHATVLPTTLLHIR